MTRTLTSRPAFLRAALVAIALLALAGAPVAFAQADDITFDVEIFRVDLVRNDAGEVEERFVETSEAVPGEVVEYRVTATNEGDRIYREGTVQVTLPIGDGVAYIEGSAGPVAEEVLIEFSTDGGESFSEPQQMGADPSEYDTIRWTFTERFEPDQEETLFYRVEVL